MSASAYARAGRLIELTAEALGLSQATRLTATDAYALASISTISPVFPASAPTTPHDVATNPDSLEEFLRLHNDFLNEADDSPRKRYAEQNRYALAVPYALTLVGRAQPVTFSSPNPWQPSNSSPSPPRTTEFPRIATTQTYNASLPSLLTTRPRGLC